MWITSERRQDIIVGWKNTNWCQGRCNGWCYISINMPMYGRNCGEEAAEESDVTHQGKQPCGEDSTCKHCQNVNGPELSKYRHCCYLLSAASEWFGAHHWAYLSTMYFTPQQLHSADQTHPMQSVVYMMSSCCRAATKVWNDWKDMSDNDKSIWLTLFRQELVR